MSLFKTREERNFIKELKSYHGTTVMAKFKTHYDKLNPIMMKAAKDSKIDGITVTVTPFANLRADVFDAKPNKPTYTVHYENAVEVIIPTTGHNDKDVYASNHKLYTAFKQWASSAPSIKHIGPENTNEILLDEFEDMYNFEMEIQVPSSNQFNQLQEGTIMGIIERGNQIISDEPAIILKTYYRVSLVRSLIDVNYINKAIQIMTEKDDENLAIATLNYIFVAADDLAKSTGPYIPKVCPDTLVTAMKLALSQISTDKYLDLIDTGRLEECVDVTLDNLNRARFDNEILVQVNNCTKAMKEVLEFLRSERAKKVGYCVANDDCSDTGMILGNTMMAKKSGLDINPTEDATRVVFGDLTDNIALNSTCIIDESAKLVLSSFQNDTICTGILEGAGAANDESVGKVKGYISEVISACNNVTSTLEAFNSNNYDLDCFVTENLTSENYVQNVTNSSFGWTHESIVLAKTGRVHALVENILGLREGTLNEDILLAKRTPEDNDVEHATLDPDKPLTIDGKNLQFVLGAAATEKNYSNRKLIAERLAEAVVNTIKWEAAHENYSDIPVVTYLNRSQRILEGLTKNTRYYDRLMETWKVVTSRVEECMQRGTFNPTPTLNELTPMPVGTRNVQLAFNDVMRANTDEEMDSAMLEFAKRHATMELFDKKVTVTQKDVDNSISNVKRVMEKYAHDYNRDPYRHDKFLKHARDLQTKYPSMRTDSYIKSGKMPILTIKQMPYNTRMGENCAIFSIGNYDEDVLRCLEPIIKDLAKDVSEERSVASDGLIKSISVDASNLNLITVKHQKVSAVTESAEYIVEAMSSQQVVDTLHKYHSTVKEPELIKVYNMLKSRLTALMKEPKYGKYLKVKNLGSWVASTQVRGTSNITYYAEYEPSIYLDIRDTIDNPVAFMGALTFDNKIRGVIRDWCANLLMYDINVGWTCKVGMEKVKYNNVKGSTYSNHYALQLKVDVPSDIINLTESMLFEAGSVGKAARAASRTIQKKEEKFIRKQGGALHEIKQAAHNAVDPMEKYVGQMLQKLKKTDADNRREIIVKGGVAPKVLRWIKRSIGLIAGAAVGSVIPAAAVITGITLIGFIATDKVLDAKEKRKIIRELDDEITLVNEKIDDSRSDENKQNKYELMRIRNELQRTRERVLLNLKE